MYQQKSECMIRYYSENVRDGKSLFLVFICIVELLVLCGCKPRGMSEKKASEAFRQYVLDPIPESVKNIRADQPKNIGGYRYTFRFNINRGHLALLTDSRPFVRIWNVIYKNRYIWWTWDQEGPFGLIMQTNAAICYDHTREPGWFKPGLWDNPEAYAFLKVGNLVNAEAFKSSNGPTDKRVLLYNEKEAEAYFVVSYWEN